MAGIGLCKNCVERVFLDENFLRIEDGLYCESCAKGEYFKLSKVGKLLHFFSENRVPIQISIEPVALITVDAHFKHEGKANHRTDGVTVEEALENMKNKYIEAMGKWVL